MKRDYLDFHESCSIMLPYPKIDIKEKNINYAKIIKKCYCGVNSELTLVTQYSYQKLLMNTYLKDIFDKIAKVEMEHLNILGELLIALGESPSFSLEKRKKNLNWSTKFINNDTSLENILIDNINSEALLIDEYRNIASIVNDENIIAILNRIILDEELHIKIFNKIYKNEIVK